MSGIIKSHVQLGDSTTATNNFMLTAQAADGTVKLARGNNGATTQDVFIVDASGRVAFPTTPKGVIQTLMTTDAGSSTTSTSTVNLSSANQAITPRSTNSQIYIRCTFRADINPLAATNVQAGYQLRDVTNNTLIGYAAVFGNISSSGGTGATGQQTLEFMVVNSTLTTRNFALWGNTGNATASAGASQCVWTLTEVQT